MWPALDADIFESYCGAMIATVALATVMVQQSVDGFVVGFGERLALIEPAAAVVLARPGLPPILAIGVVKAASGKSPDSRAACRNDVRCIGLHHPGLLPGRLPGRRQRGVGLPPWSVPWVVCIIGLSTEYYTAGKPIREHCQVR